MRLAPPIGMLALGAAGTLPAIAGILRHVSTLPENAGGVVTLHVRDVR
jgi:hypothetical protein